MTYIFPVNGLIINQTFTEIMLIDLVMEWQMQHRLGKNGTLILPNNLHMQALPIMSHCITQIHYNYFNKNIIACFDVVHITSLGQQLQSAMDSGTSIILVPLFGPSNKKIERIDISIDISTRIVKSDPVSDYDRAMGIV